METWQTGVGGDWRTAPFACGAGVACQGAVRGTFRRPVRCHLWGWGCRRLRVVGRHRCRESHLRGTPNSLTPEAGDRQGGWGGEARGEGISVPPPLGQGQTMCLPMGVGTEGWVEDIPESSKLSGTARRHILPLHSDTCETHRGQRCRRWLFSASASPLSSRGADGWLQAPASSGRQRATPPPGQTTTLQLQGSKNGGPDNSAYCDRLGGTGNPDSVQKGLQLQVRTSARSRFGVGQTRAQRLRHYCSPLFSTIATGRPVPWVFPSH